MWLKTLEWLEITTQGIYLVSKIHHFIGVHFLIYLLVVPIMRLFSYNVDKLNFW